MYHSADSTVVNEWGDCHKQSEQASSLHSAFFRDCSASQYDCWAESGIGSQQAWEIFVSSVCNAGQTVFTVPLSGTVNTFLSHRFT